MVLGSILSSAEITFDSSLHNLGFVSSVLKLQLQELYASFEKQPQQHYT